MRPVKMTTSLRLHVWTALVLAGFCAFGQNPPSADKGAASEQEKAAPASAAKKEYVGSEICQGCHEDIFKGFEKNRHHAVEVDKGRGWSGKACEACHGPASVHTESMSADDIINPAKLSPGQADKACLKCHSNQPTHVGRIQGRPRPQRCCLRRLPFHAQSRRRPAGQRQARRRQQVLRRLSLQHLGPVPETL